MAIKKSFSKWTLVVLLVWFLAEVSYQIYLRNKYVTNGDYHWENYVVKRNASHFLILKSYFSHYKNGKYFNLSYFPDEGNIAILPKEVQENILAIKKDLLNGFDVFKTNHSFDIYYENIDNTHYKLEISAGSTFKSAYNGYDFEAVITNDMSSSYACEKTSLAEVYVCREYLKEKEYQRPTPFILRYNCNSYDLLILKLFR